MSKRTVIILCSTVAAVLVLAAGGLFAYDQTNSDTIAKGVTVGGVEVGGMSTAAARAKLNEAYLSQLKAPVVVRGGGRTFHLTAKQARITTNVDAMVDEALARSRSGDPFSRAVRDLTGGTVNADLAPQVTYSRAAVTRMVNRIRASVDRKAVDATATFDSDGPVIKPAQDGLQVQAAALHRKISRAVGSPTADRTIRVAVRRTTPAVTTAQIDQRFQTALVVDRSAFTLKLYKNLKLVKSYDVAVGQQGLETPAGLYNIQDKQVDPAWHVPNSAWTGDLAGQVIPGGTPENPLKARWLGIFDGAGIHGVDPSEYGSIGHAASHGCVRMRIPDVIDLYDRVPVGAPIYIS